MIRLHHIAQSRSFRVMRLLKQFGLRYALITRAFNTSLGDPAYLALSPAGRVPGLGIDGLGLFKSGTIAEYVVETRGPHSMCAPCFWRPCKRRRCANLARVFYPCPEA
jgi:glutathione S-transferase